MSAKNETVKSKTNELRLTRLYDAPIQVVWDAWTDPAKAAQWWGPRGFTITTHSKDLRVGGHWHYTMHGPDGVDYPNKTKYLEVEDCAKLVYDHGANDDQPPMFRVTVLFSESNGKTKMDMCMTLPTPEAAEATRKFVKKAGGNATWDRLAEYLSHDSANKELFVINRSFDAPIDKVFEMWTNPDYLSKWLPPPGFDMKLIKCEKPQYIAYTQQFCDENENVTRHPMAPTWPATMLTTVCFAAEGPEQTRVTISTECYGDTTLEELATFVSGRGGMTIGWTASFDKLEEYLVALE